MDAGEALRTARRRAGLSQRALAEATDLPASSIAAYEAGARSPSLSVLNALLRAAGLELALSEALPAPTPLMRAHLEHSLTRRLDHSVTGGAPAGPRRERWTQLWEVAREHRVTVLGAAAAGTWVPRGGATHLEVAVGDAGTVPSALADLAPDLELRPGADCRRGTIPVRWRQLHVYISPPGELALTEPDRELAVCLRVAARLLHDEQWPDRSGRRAPAHRDPRHAAETWRNHETRLYRRMPMVRDDDLRSWRLGVPVGYLAWLASMGYPEDRAPGHRGLG